VPNAQQQSKLVIRSSYKRSFMSFTRLCMDYLIAYCEQVEEDDTTQALDQAEVLRVKRSTLEHSEYLVAKDPNVYLTLLTTDESPTILNFFGGISQIVKDISDRRALHYGLSIGETEPPSIRLVRSRLESLVASFRRRIKETQAELVAVRQSLAATHWLLLETSTASQPPSSSGALSEESNTPPAIK
jgi:hypothetical protein